MACGHDPDSVNVLDWVRCLEDLQGGVERTAFPQLSVGGLRYFQDDILDAPKYGLVI